MVILYHILISFINFLLSFSFLNRDLISKIYLSHNLSPIYLFFFAYCIYIFKNKRNLLSSRIFTKYLEKLYNFISIFLIVI